jgi:hypothetical protein
VPPRAAGSGARFEWNARSPRAAVKHRRCARAPAVLQPLPSLNPAPPLRQLCAGHMRVKNANNILLKNLLDCVIGTVTWMLMG